MKTSIIISSIAALLLMITFAESPSRRNVNKLNASTTDEISFIQINGLMPLTETKKTIIKKEASDVTLPSIPAEDYSYLKFNVSDFIASDANLDVYDVLPENTVSDYSYLKFDVNEYTNNSEFTDSETIELPEHPANDFSYLRFNADDYYTTGDIETIETVVNEFSYLKFDVNSYYSQSVNDTESTYELPE
jgi:hypothetical protein